MQPHKPEHRPVFLDLRRIRQPVTAIVSIAHRASGVLLALSIPFWIYLLDLSLGSSAGYEHAIELLSQPLAKLGAVVVSWALIHHLCAGVRFLLLDIDIGIELQAARRSAWIVNGVGVLGALLALAVIL